MDRAADNLVQRILADEPGSYGEILAGYGAEVLRLCYFLLHDRQEAEDVLQETMLALMKAIREGTFRAMNGHLKGFLMQIARRKCIDRLRRSRRLRPFEDWDEEAVEPEQEISRPDRMLDRQRAQEAFDLALAELPDLHRVTLVLHELNGESYKQIAETLNISIESVKKNIFRARKKLRILLAPYRDAL